MRTGDKKYLKTLGPYSCALSVAIGMTEYVREDRITPGEDMNDDLGLGYFRGCFLLFRGGVIKKEWIYEYERYLKKHIYFNL